MLLFQALPIYTRDRFLVSPRSTDPICFSPMGLHPPKNSLLITTLHPAVVLFCHLEGWCKSQELDQDLELAQEFPFQMSFISLSSFLPKPPAVAGLKHLHFPCLEENCIFYARAEVSRDSFNFAESCPNGHPNPAKGRDTALQRV